MEELGHTPCLISGGGSLPFPMCLCAAQLDLVGLVAFADQPAGSAGGFRSLPLVPASNQNWLSEPGRNSTAQTFGQTLQNFDQSTG